MIPTTTEETVTITKKEYDALIRSKRFLSGLEEAGVDNWEGYHNGYRAAYPEDFEDEDCED